MKKLNPLRTQRMQQLQEEAKQARLLEQSKSNDYTQNQT